MLVRAVWGYQQRRDLGHGGTTPATIDVSTASGSASLVYQVDRTGGVVTVSSIDVTTSAGLASMTTGLSAGAPRLIELASSERAGANNVVGASTVGESDDAFSMATAAMGGPDAGFTAGTVTACRPLALPIGDPLEGGQHGLQ